MTRLTQSSKQGPFAALKTSTVFAIKDIKEYWPFATPAPSWEAMQKWVYRGLDGVKLRSALIAGRRCTTVEWLHDFIEATQEEKTD